MEYPITVNKIEFAFNPRPVAGWRGKEVGKFVSIRPCGEKYKNKTYLGMLLGDMPLGVSASFNEESGTLTIDDALRNPAIWVFDTNEVVFGAESWWGLIKNEDQLRKITDEDINSVWYVKALKQIQEMEEHNGD